MQRHLASLTVTARELFSFFYFLKEHGLYNFLFFKTERRVLHSESLYNKILNHKQFIKSIDKEPI